MLERGNILVLNPTHGHSHVHFVGSIADMLANDGHNVVSLFSFFFLLFFHSDGAFSNLG